MNKDSSIQLSTRIAQVVTYAFANPDLSYTQLGKHFNISIQRISQIMNHPKVLASYPILARRRIKSLVPSAVKRLERLMNQNVNLNVSEKAVSKILDSEKVLEPSVRHIVHEIQTKSVKELQDIIQGGKELPRQVIEAEISEHTQEQE